MTPPTLLFLDIESLGVRPGVAIWEVAAIRVDGWEISTLETMVRHDPDNCDPDFPDWLSQMYGERYDNDAACHPKKLLVNLSALTADGAIVCGSNPRFDMDALERLADEHHVPRPPWHYHPIDVPGMVHGYLIGKGIKPAPPWRSDFLSQAVGIDPRDYERHTAMGDVQWCRALWDTMNPAPTAPF